MAAADSPDAADPCFECGGSSAACPWPAYCWGGRGQPYEIPDEDVVIVPSEMGTGLNTWDF